MNAVFLWKYDSLYNAFWSFFLNIMKVSDTHPSCKQPSEFTAFVYTYDYSFV